MGERGAGRLWAKFHLWIITSGLWAELGKNEAKVLAVLIARALRPNRQVWISNARLAAEAGVWRGRVPAATARLQELGLVRKWRHPRGTCCYYIPVELPPLQDAVRSSRPHGADTKANDPSYPHGADSKTRDGVVSPRDHHRPHRADERLYPRGADTKKKLEKNEREEARTAFRQLCEKLPKAGPPKSVERPDAPRTIAGREDTLRELVAAVGSARAREQLTRQGYEAAEIERAMDALRGE